MIVYLRGLRIQNLVRGMAIGVEYVEALLDYVLQVDWANTPGYLWYDYGSDNVQANPRHYADMDDRKNHAAFPRKAVPDAVPRKAVAVVPYIPAYGRW